MAFFANTGPGGFEPKRQFRFLINFTELSGLTFMATDTTKPSYELGTMPHKILNHQFNFPTTVTWSPITVGFIDAIDPNVGSKFYNALRNAGYVNPTSETALVTGITKVQSTSTIGEVKIKQLDGGGIILPAGADPGEVLGAVDTTNIVEEWTLKNAFITKVSFGTLSYAATEMLKIECGIVYDYATYSGTPTVYAG